MYDGKTMGCRSVPPQHLGVYFRDAESKGQPLEVAFTIGNHPYVTLCSQISGSIYLDELNVAGGWMGQPVDVVESRRSMSRFPRPARLLLKENWFPAKDVQKDPLESFPVIIRRSPSSQFQIESHHASSQPDLLDSPDQSRPDTIVNHVMKEVILEAILYDRLRQICPTLRDVTSPKVE